MSKLCKVSVVIPCFNHGEFLLEAIESVDRIKRDDIEIVVVDDGSTDKQTRTEIDKLSTVGMRVIRQEKKGLGAARNAGILAASAQYIFPLDADDRLRSGWMDTGIGILDSNPRVGVVYGDAQCFGTQTHRWVVGPFSGERLLNYNFIHCSALFRKAVWEQNRGYETDMPVQGVEDWDFWIGAFEHGWLFEYLPDIVFDYRRAEQSMLTRVAGFEEQINEFVARKHGLLYRQAWLAVVSERQNERESIKWTLRNLGKLFGTRLKRRFHQDSGRS